MSHQVSCSCMLAVGTHRGLGNAGEVLKSFRKDDIEYGLVRHSI